LSKIEFEVGIAEADSYAFGVAQTPEGSKKRTSIQNRILLHRILPTSQLLNAAKMRSENIAA
jgi:hypothetical protein